MRDTWNMTPDEARKYILQNWFDGDENVNAFVCGDEEYTAMAIAVEALEAARWHYPSKGDYPNENGEYLFLVKAFSNIYRVVGDYEILKNQRLWYAEIADHCIEDEPIAWMPLPELPKEEEV
jgi:hypothetical protein